MATTLDTYAPYDAGAGADAMEATWRKMMRRVLETGVIAHVTNEFNVFADSTGMQVKVNTGECWIQGQWGESTAQKTLAIAANSSGSTRGDRVILRNDFVNNRIELDVLTGVSATPPAVTQDTSKWEISLATVSVPNADASIDAGQVTDDRQWTHIPGDPLTFWGVQAVSQSVPNATWTNVTFTTEVLDRKAWHSTSSNTSRVIPNKPGWYQVKATGAVSVASANVAVAVARNGTRVAGLPSTAAGTADPGVSAAHAQGLVLCNGTTDYLELQVYQAAGSASATAITTDLCSSLQVSFHTRG